MILREHNISVRLPQERSIDTGITFVQNDKGVYKLNIRVFDGDTEINYSQVSSATITFSKADGTVVQGDMQKATNMLTYYLGTNEIAAPGKLIATIQLLGANERLTTARFLFRVEKDLITEDAVKSTSEFPILQKLKKELEEIDVVDLRNDLEAHLAENVTQGDNPHGLIYEAGTWTPALNRTGAVYSQQYGHYIRIGNIVFCVGRIVLSSKGTSSLGTAISGLPFPVVDTNHRLQGIVCHNITLPTGFYNTVARLGPTSIYVYKSSGNWSDWLTYNEVQDNSEFYINISYRIA